MPKLLFGLSEQLATRLTDVEIELVSCFRGSGDGSSKVAPGVKLTYLQDRVQHRSDMPLIKKILFWATLGILFFRWVRDQDRKDAVFVSCTPAVTLFLIVLAPKLRSIAWENVDFFIYSKALNIFRLICYRRLFRLVAPTSREAALLRASGINAVYIPNINFSHANECSRHILGTPVRLVAIGRLERQKGFDLLILSCACSEARSFSWTLDIVGSGSEEGSLRALVSELGLSDRVRFHPFTPDLLNFYLSADVFMMTSRYEGMPLVLLEAMSHGIPCFAYACGSGPSDIIVSGENGEVVPFGDRDALWSAVRSATECPERYASLRRGARSSSLKFRPEEVVTRWVQLFSLEV